ncbi:MAG: hypothetical protein PVJ92_00400 [Candidatus Dependentiae bacterium]|jgi:ABC-type uncharacterized transport system substrate-binding protein
MTQLALDNSTVEQLALDRMLVEVFYENKEAEYPPLIVVLSHIRNDREYEATNDLVHKLLRKFGHTAPSVIAVSAQNSTAIMYGEVTEWIHHADKCAIVTFSQWAAQALAHGTRSIRLGVPHIFTGMHDVSTFESFDTAHPSYAHTTGLVVKHPSYYPMMRTVMDWHTGSKRLWCLNHPDHVSRDTLAGRCGLSQENLEACKSLGLEVLPLMVRSNEELDVKLSSRLQPKSDLILTGLSGIALAYSDTISLLAELHQTPVISQSLEVVKKGHAAVGHGSWGDFTTELMVQRLFQMIVHGEKARSFPLEIVKEAEQVRYNEEVMEKQGLLLGGATKRTLRARSIHDGY